VIHRDRESVEAGFSAETDEPSGDRRRGRVCRCNRYYIILDLTCMLLRITTVTDYPFDLPLLSGFISFTMRWDKRLNTSSRVASDIVKRTLSFSGR